jgi:hypothetical protein
VIRDLEIQGDSVRVTVVAAAGELSLPDLTQALTRAPGFDDVRFVDAASARGYRFSWRLRPSAGPTADARPSPSEPDRS